MFGNASATIIATAPVSVIRSRIIGLVLVGSVQDLFPFGFLAFRVRAIVGVLVTLTPVLLPATITEPLTGFPDTGCALCRPSLFLASIAERALGVHGFNMVSRS